MNVFSFKNKILTVMILLVLGSITVSFVSSSQLVQTHLLSTGTQNIESELKLVADRVKTEVTSALRLASSIPLNLGNMNKVVHSSGFYRVTKVMYGSVFTTDSSVGDQTGASPQYLTLEKQEEQRYQTIADNTGSEAKVWEVQSVNDNPTLIISKPSIDSSGGVDIFEVRLQPIFDSISNANSVASGLELVTDGGMLLFSSVVPQMQPLESVIVQVGDQQWSLNGYISPTHIEAETNALVSQVAFYTLISGVIFMGIAVVALRITYRPIIALRNLIEELASGDADLTKRLSVKSHDDLGRISSSINQFVSNLQSLVQEIKSTSNTVALQADDLENRVNHNLNQAVAHNTELEKAVTAITEMSTAAEGVASIAKQAAMVTGSAMEVSQRGQATIANAVVNVDSLTTEMDNMAESVSSMVSDVKNISDVLNVIGGIAEQTNLLALNAAIEAARAGEQGRGFAVVADEVRALAARTAQSTEQIGEMLSKLEKGSHQVVIALEETKNSSRDTSTSTNHISDELTTLTQAVDKLTDLNASVAQSAVEQKEVSGEISLNMHTLFSVMSELQSNSQQVVKTTQDLMVKNQGLNALVDRFKVEDNQPSILQGVNR